MIWMVHDPICCKLSKLSEAKFASYLVTCLSLTRSNSHNFAQFASYLRTCLSLTRSNSRKQLRYAHLLATPLSERR